MSPTKRTTPESDYQALYEELERRYGPGLAQEILDQIKKVEKPNDNNPPGFMQVKALSETTELFRKETRKALREMKESKKNYDDNKDVINMAYERAKQDCDAYFKGYLISQKSFYCLYRKAMVAYVAEQPKRKTYQPIKADTNVMRAG